MIIKYTSESDIWNTPLYAMYTWKELIPDNSVNDKFIQDKNVVKGDSGERNTKIKCVGDARIMFLYISIKKSR